MTPHPLDYATPRDDTDRVIQARRRALILLLIALALDGVAMVLGTSGGGSGWIAAAPCIWGSGLLAPICAVLAITFAIVSIARAGGRDFIGWLVIAAALVGACAGMLMGKISIDAVASV